MLFQSRGYRISKDPTTKLKDMDFHTYVNILKSKVLEFREGCEWDSNTWNESYGDFKHGLKAYSTEYLKSVYSKDLVVEWATEFYLPANRDTHDYWVVKKLGEWYVADVTKPMFKPEK